jgi:ankyrin repeat protein
MKKSVKQKMFLFVFSILFAMFLIASLDQKTPKSCRHKNHRKTATSSRADDLHAAIKNKNITKVKSLIRDTRDANRCVERLLTTESIKNKQTPLMDSIETGSLEFVKDFIATAEQTNLDIPSFLNQENSDGITPLIMSLVTKKRYVTDLLIRKTKQHHGNVKNLITVSKRKEFIPPFFIPCNTNCVETMEMLFRAFQNDGGDIQKLLIKRDSHGNTALLSAIVHRSYKTVEKMLDIALKNNLDFDRFLNAKNRDELSPLSAAIILDDKKITHKLLQMAQIRSRNIEQFFNSKDPAGNTPLILAAQKRLPGIMKEIIVSYEKSGGNPKNLIFEENIDKQNALSIAIESNSQGAIESLAKALLITKRDLSLILTSTNSSEITPLMLALKTKKFVAAQALIRLARIYTPDRKKILRKRDIYGNNIIDYARKVAAPAPVMLELRRLQV